MYSPLSAQIHDISPGLAIATLITRILNLCQVPKFQFDIANVFIFVIQWNLDFPSPTVLLVSANESFNIYTRSNLLVLQPTEASSMTTTLILTAILASTPFVLRRICCAVCPLQ